MAQFRHQQVSLLFRLFTACYVDERGYRPARIALGVAQGRRVAEEVPGRTVIEADLLFKIAYIFAARRALDGQLFRRQNAAIQEHLEITRALIFGG